MGIDIVQWWSVDWYCDGCSEVVMYGVKSGLVEAVKSDRIRSWWSDVARWSEGIVNLVKPISQWIWHLWPSGGCLYLGKQKTFLIANKFCFVLSPWPLAAGKVLLNGQCDQQVTICVWSFILCVTLATEGQNLVYGWFSSSYVATVTCKGHYGRWGIPYLHHHPHNTCPSSQRLTPSWPPMPPPVKNFNPSYLSQFWFFFGFEGWKWKQRCVALCMNQKSRHLHQNWQSYGQKRFSTSISHIFFNFGLFLDLRVENESRGVWLYAESKIEAFASKLKKLWSKTFFNFNLSYHFFNFGLFLDLRVANESRGVWLYAKSKIKAFASKLTKLWSKTFFNFNLSYLFHHFEGNFDFLTCLRG